MRLLLLLIPLFQCQCPFDKGTLMEIADLGMKSGLGDEIIEILWKNYETRRFMDELILKCRHSDPTIIRTVSPKNREVLLKVFDEPKMLSQTALGQLGIG